MGLTPSNVSLKDNKMRFDPNNWQQIPLQSYTNNSDPHYSSNFVVVAHKNSPGLQAQKYQVFFNSQSQYISYLELFYERKKMGNLVNTLHIEKSTKRGMCSTFLSTTVYIERIPIRLFQITDMPINQGLYMIETALLGYEQIFQKTGYFQVSSDMIGINRQGQVKVWINRNLSKNFPDFNKIDHNKGEKDFVIRVVGIIDQAIDYSGHYPSFLQFICDKKKVINFQTTLSYLKLYMQNWHISSQKVMKSILVVYRNSENDSNFSKSFFRKNQYRESQKTNNDTSSITTNRKMDDKQGKYKGDRSFEKMQKNNTHFNVYAQQNNQQKNAIHISFIKNQPKIFDLDDSLHHQSYPSSPEPPMYIKTGCMTPNAISNYKNPSISFYYKNPNGGLYSPQNIYKTTKYVNKVQKGQQRLAKRRVRKSMPATDQQQRKMQYYNSNGDIHEIDPDIATDLQRFSS